MPLLPPDQARAIGALASVGLSFVLAVVIGITVGLWLDGKLGTSPWLLILGFFLGSGAALNNVMRTAKELDAERRREQVQRGTSGAPDDRAAGPR